MQTYLIIKRVLGEQSYFLLFLLLAVIFYGLFILIPVATIPGNDLKFQLSIYSGKDYLLMGLLAILVGLNFALLTYSRKHQSIKSVPQGAATGILGIFGAIVGTAACASCLAILFGLVGLGTASVFFVLTYKSYFLLGAVTGLLVSLYFVTRKVNRICNLC